MAIIISTDRPTDFLNEIKELINNNVIKTWSYDMDGDFTLTGQMQDKAWFSPKTTKKSLSFYIVGRYSIKMQIQEYVFFHSQFAEMLMLHFNEKILGLKITMPNSNKNDYSNIE